VRQRRGAFAAADRAPEAKEAMPRQGNVLEPSTPGAAAQYFRTETTRRAALAKKAGVASGGARPLYKRRLQDG